MICVNLARLTCPIRQRCEAFLDCRFLAQKLAYFVQFSGIRLTDFGIAQRLLIAILWPVPRLLVGSITVALHASVREFDAESRDRGGIGVAHGRPKHSHGLGQAAVPGVIGSLRVS